MGGPIGRQALTVPSALRQRRAQFPGASRYVGASTVASQAGRGRETPDTLDRPDCNARRLGLAPTSIDAQRSIMRTSWESLAGPAPSQAHGTRDDPCGPWISLRTYAALALSAA